MEALGIGLASWISELINYNNNFSASIFENSMVNALLIFISVLADSLFVIGIIFAIFEIGVNSHEGKGSSISELFINIIKGLIATACLTTMPVLLLKFTNEICHITCQVFTENSAIQILYEGFSTSTTNLIGGWGFVILMIISFVCVFKVFLANLKRGGILITLMMIGAIHAFSVPRGYLDAFYGWCKQVIGLCITSFMSNVLIVLGALVYSTNQGADFGDLVLGVGVMLAAAEVPRIAQQFGLDTSMKTNVSQAIYGISGVTSIIRAFV
ncbi:MAG: hypothetical protein J1E85_06300 [Ruminococcus sp.]|nr:hypothetical protein [Ruminococcus sp.]